MDRGDRTTTAQQENHIEEQTIIARVREWVADHKRSAITCAAILSLFSATYANNSEIIQKVVSGEIGVRQFINQILNLPYTDYSRAFLPEGVTAFPEHKDNVHNLAADAKKLNNLELQNPDVEIKFIEQPLLITNSDERKFSDRILYTDTSKNTAQLLAENSERAIIEFNFGGHSATPETLANRAIGSILYYKQLDREKLASIRSIYVAPQNNQIPDNERDILAEDEIQDGIALYSRFNVNEYIKNLTAKTMPFLLIDENGEITNSHANGQQFKGTIAIRGFSAGTQFSAELVNYLVSKGFSPEKIYFIPTTPATIQLYLHGEPLGRHNEIGALEAAIKSGVNTIAFAAEEENILGAAEVLNKFSSMAQLYGSGGQYSDIIIGQNQTHYDNWIELTTQRVYKEILRTLNRKADNTSAFYES